MASEETPPPPPPHALPSPSHRPATTSQRDSFPSSITGPLTCASIASSTAEGKAIPVDHTTAEHRTSALRELNSRYPSRHRYANSTGAASSTCSEPVIVRSYHPPSNNASSNDRWSCQQRRGGGSGSGSGSEIAAGGPGPAAIVVGSTRPPRKVTSLLSGVASLYRRRTPTSDVPPDARLPPLEAFRFSSFLTDAAAAGSHDINADLDKIAGICARSRYSLSDQYEAHYAPQGSGTLPLTPDRTSEAAGPTTLQAVPSDDDERDAGNDPTRRRRRLARSGALETIMSSSRSSDEEKSKKPGASDLRGRTAKKTSGSSTPRSSSPRRKDGADL
ncbi:hypothetical protein AAL_03781 [Moelleriella libera RCEF 2490]|uniref:Uncharacterized protein n=1 Tax=Moelleriella libera RCEF 2490 TaxID=1081109 RepID=A0A162INL6_9HYPO|nr:hypothetical protein AAL_03781 [Moelleriella libera RCEF 2490]